MGKDQGENIVEYRETYRKLADLLFEPTSLHCYVCRTNYTLNKAFNDHIVQHLQGEIEEPYQENLEHHFTLCFCNDRLVNEVHLNISKLVKKKLFINNIFLYKPVVNEVISLCKDFSIKDAIELYMDRKHFSLPNQNYLIIIAFIVEGKEQHEVFEEHILQLGNMPKIEKINMNCIGRTELLEDFRKSRSWTSKPLKPFRPTDYLLDVVKYNFRESENITQLNLIRKYENFLKKKPMLTSTTYHQIMSFALHIEECYRMAELLKFTMINATFRITHSSKIILEIDEHIEYCPYFDDSVYLKIRSMTNGRVIIGRILDVKPKKMEIEISQENFDFQSDYIVEFHLYRRIFQVEHNTLHLLEKTKWKEFLFPTSNDATYVEKLHLTEYEWYNKEIKSNPEQIRAIKNVVLGTSGTAPYIIFGPPGTGKTVTIIESILQVLKQCINPYILVTAMSNSACDEVAIRLLKYLPNESILRLYAQHAIDQAAEDLWVASNIMVHDTDQYYHFYPRLQTLYKFRVVIVTMTTSVRLFQANIANNHFTHVFIDECGSARETMSLSSIAGIVSTSKGIHARVVLSGDPKQLGPLVYSKRACELRLNISLLERLMEFDLYKKDSKTKEYNSNFITKLVKNYRSHPTIIKVSNKLFYEKEIQCEGNRKIINSALGWRMLPNPNIPLIFHDVKGETKKDTFSKSCFNMEEIRVVIAYLIELTKSPIKNFKSLNDIGIVSPYRTQVRIIQEECIKRKWGEIEVGTVEKFQGREKPIIIVSTVRATPQSVGFLDNPKRMNVTLTRAKCLLIVIGDTRTLKKNPQWKSFIDYCLEKNAVTQNRVII